MNDINVLEMINKLSPDRVDRLYKSGYTLDDAIRALSIPRDLIDISLCSYVANVMRNCDGILYYTSCIKSYVAGQYTVLKLLYPNIPAIDVFFRKYALGYFELYTKCDPNSPDNNPQAIHRSIVERLNFEYASDLADLLNDIANYQKSKYVVSALAGIGIAVVVYLGYSAAKDIKKVAQQLKES